MEKGGRGSLGKFGLSTAFRTERVGAATPTPLHRPGFPGVPLLLSGPAETTRWCGGSSLRT